MLVCTLALVAPQTFFMMALRSTPFAVLLCEGSDSERALTAEWRMTGGLDAPSMQ